MKLLRGVLAGSVLLALGMGLTAAVVLALGGDPGRALRAIHAGSLSSPSSLAETFLKATPLVFTGLSVAVAFRAGIWNIGVEGQFLVGMLGGTVAALLLPPLPGPLAVLVPLLAGSIAGLLWAAGPAFLKLRRQVPEVISTIMLNFLAVYLIEYLVRGPMKDPGSASDWSPLLPDATYLPRLSRWLGVQELGGGSLALPGGTPLLATGVEAGRLHVGVLLAMLALVAAWLWLDRTGAGFRIRALGLGPSAARAAGISTASVARSAFLISGALAGLGGAVELLGIIQRLYRYAPGTPGYGFSGIAVALLGGLSPPGILGAALFFGALSAGCSQMQRSAAVSAQVASVVQAGLVLLLLLFQGRWGILLGGRSNPSHTDSLQNQPAPAADRECLTLQKGEPSE
ncbi:MAG: ABC transporter permease [Armatimonadetes bacterium]|nr:ABC transporter permease [Armatimonadota bacterium]